MFIKFLVYSLLRTDHNYENYIQHDEYTYSSPSASKIDPFKMVLPDVSDDFEKQNWYGAISRHYTYSAGFGCKETKPEY